MRSWKRSLGLAFVVGAVLAVAVVLFPTWDFFTQDIIDVIAMVVVVGALIGLYVLHHYARTRLVYNRHATSNADVPDTAPDETRNVTTPFAELARRVWW
jgi:predicted ferric reductase